MGQPVEGRAAGPAESDVLAEPAERRSDRDEPGSRMLAPLPEQTRRASRISGVWGFVDRHWIIGILLVAASALRVTAIIAYRPALWFNDSFEYVSDAVNRMPSTERPSGYSLFLILLQPLHSFMAVVVAQHLMGLASGVMIYALLRRRGLPDWGACLAALPVLFDAYQVQLEHLVMSDTLFTFLITLAVFLLCWRDRPSVLTAVAAGALTGAAVLVRTVGLPLLAVVAVCLLIRKAGWRPIVAGLAAGVLPVLLYATWFHSAYGKFALTESDGPFLYARVMAFAECSKVKPPKDLQALCDPRPPSQRPSTPEYPWTVGNPLYYISDNAPFTPKPSHMAGRFAMLAIERQPLDYIRVTVVDTAKTFGWNRSLTYPDPLTAEQYQFNTKAAPIPNWANFNQASLYQTHGNVSTTVTEPYARILVVYMRYFYLRGAMLGVILLIGAAWVIYGRRRGAPGLIPWFIAAALITEPAATAGFSYRYVVAAVPVACMAGGLAFVRSRPALHARTAAQAPKPDRAA
jgi:hypothetical protein